jgi:hypothetical protein
MQSKFLAALAILSFIALSPLRDAKAGSSVPAFEITGTGKLVHFETAPFDPAEKAPVTNVKITDIASCIVGTALGCTPGDNTLENNGGGKAYLYILDETHIGIATNNACSNLTVLEGLVDGAGNFMFRGNHAKSDTDILVQGKVIFAKGTLTLIGIKAASVLAISNKSPLEHYGVGKFSTVTGSGFPGCI